MSVTALTAAGPEPAPSVTDADRIAQDSTKIELDDGKSYELHYGFGGLRKIEARFGSVKTLLDRITDGMGDGYYDAVFHGILFGLWRTGMTEEQLEDLIDPSDQDRYGPALNNALIAAFPKEAQELIRQRAEEAKAEATSSPGPTTTTSQRSASGGRSKSSGK